MFLKAIKIWVQARLQNKSGWWTNKCQENVAFLHTFVNVC